MVFSLDPTLRPAGVALTADSHIIFRGRTLAVCAVYRLVYVPFRVLAPNKGRRPPVSEEAADPPLAFTTAAMRLQGVTADATLKACIPNVEIAERLPRPR